MVGHASRLVRALLAAGLALVVLSGTGGTGASWSQSVQLEPGSLQAGNLAVTTDEARVELHSRQPSSSRTYVSTEACTPDTSFTECRVITNTIDDEALIPGDRVVITQKATLAAKGTNLEGTFAIDTGSLTSSATSAFSGSATTTTQVTPPGGNAGTATSFPVVAGADQGVGEYTVRSRITTSPTNAGTSWGTQLQGQRLYDGAYTFTFTQTN